MPTDMTNEEYDKIRKAEKKKESSENSGSGK